ncbi:MAG: hypothetical protein WC054_00960 [Candidatus Nanopelagicales bacterium]
MPEVSGEEALLRSLDELVTLVLRLVIRVGLFAVALIGGVAGLRADVLGGFGVSGWAVAGAGRGQVGDAGSGAHLSGECVMAEQSFPVPAAAMMLVDREGRFRVWPLPEGEDEMLLEQMGTPFWEGAHVDLDQALEMMKAVAYFRTTQRFTYKVDRRD